MFPTSEEIRSIVKRMPQEKSPSLDGMTVKVLSGYWSFIGNDSMDMIRNFWNTKLLPKKLHSMHHKHDLKEGRQMMTGGLTTVNYASNHLQTHI